jgi:hypothetical protein
MPRFAVVNSDNIVENVIVWDEASDWTPPDGRFIVKAEEIRCDIGWIHNNGEFSEPPEEPTDQAEPANP